MRAAKVERDENFLLWMKEIRGDIWAGILINCVNEICKETNWELAKWQKVPSCILCATYRPFTEASCDTKRQHSISSWALCAQSHYGNFVWQEQAKSWHSNNANFQPQKPTDHRFKKLASIFFVNGKILEISISAACKFSLSGWKINDENSLHAGSRAAILHIQQQQQQRAKSMLMLDILVNYKKNLHHPPLLTTMLANDLQKRLLRGWQNFVFTLCSNSSQLFWHWRAIFQENLETSNRKVISFHNIFIT